MRIWPKFLSTIAALCVASSALAQGGWTVTHQPPTCLSSLCGKTVISATVAGDPAPDFVRVYFKAGTEGPDYYVEMTKIDGAWEAVLPAPLRDTSAVTYRIVAGGANGATSSTDVVTVPATADCQLTSLSAAQAEAAMNTVIGLTEAGQTGAPVGFSCVGITKVVGVDQTMAPNNACEEVKLAKSDPCFVPVAGDERAGMGLTGAVLIGAGVVAGAVIIEDNNDDDRTPVSNSRP